MKNLNTPERRREVRRKYDPLFWRQPNINGVSLGRIRDENGNITNTWSITLRVTKKVDQATLPPEDRIPESIEGIPIQILEEQPAPLAHGGPSSNHRPVLPGLKVEAGTRDPVTRLLTRVSGGTITGPAWREDGTKVVLMCQHSVTGSIIDNPVGGEVVCQPTMEEANVIGQVPPRISTQPAWHPTTPSGANEIDATYFIPSVGADFGPHKDPTHTVRHILSGAVEPVEAHENTQELLVVGAAGGEGMVTVTDIDYTWRSPDDKVVLTDTILLDVSSRPIVNGDSGAPCLAHVTGDRYRMYGILFGGDSNIGHAFKATKAQELLKVTFGYQVPVADIVAPQEVHPGELVQLDGSGSKVRSPAGKPLTYQWEQDFGSAHAAIASRNRVTLSSKTAVSPTFTAPAHGTTLTFKLTVTDSHSAKASDTVTVNVNTPPKAVPGWNQAVPINTSVTLTGGVKDPDTGHAGKMDYEWSLVEAPGGSSGSGSRSMRSVPGSSSGSSDSSLRSAPATRAPSSRITLTTPMVNGKSVLHKRTFTPRVVGDYVFKLKVTDPGKLSGEAKMTVHCCEATGTSEWYDTGEKRVADGENEKRQTRVHNGATQWQWIIDPIQPLGTLSPGGSIVKSGSWTSAIASENRPPGRYARYYAFRVGSRARFQIDLESEDADAYLYLLSGAGTGGAILDEDDDFRSTTHSRVVEDLDPGVYTIEATTYAAGWTGEFTLKVAAFSLTPAVQSSDATLKGLTLSPSSASLTPPFVPGTASYTASVGNAVSALRVTPTANHAQATVTVNGATVTGGQPSGAINLKVGKTTIAVVVTAEDGTKKTYSVEVTRAAAPAASARPAAPTGLTATAGNGLITLQWSNPGNPNITRYEYRLREGAGAWGSWTGISGSGASTVSYVKTGLTNGTAYTLQLRAVNARGAGLPAQAGPVTPTAPPPPPGLTADAGPDQTVRTGAAVTLDGSGSSDPDGDALTYKWVQLGEPGTPSSPGIPAVTLSSPTAVKPTFTAPARAGGLSFKLTVTDPGSLSDSDTVTIAVTATSRPVNRRPIANAGPDRTYQTASRGIVLDGSGSSDPDGNPLTYQWKYLSGTRVAINNANQARASFTERSTGFSATFRLTVTDPGGLSDTDDVTIAVGVWVDTGKTRNRRTGSWTYTGNTREDDINLVYEEEQTSTISWEKEQRHTGTGETRWVSASSTQTKWSVIPEECGSWSDTGRTRIKAYGTYRNVVPAVYSGSGANRKRKQTRTNTREKQQSCTTNAPYHNTRYQWISITSTTDTRWVPDPIVVEIWPATWTDTGNTKNRAVGSWRNLSTYQGCGPNRKRKQSRLTTWKKEQFQRSNLGNRRTKWVAASSIGFRYVAAAEPLRWGSWTDTGQTREHPVELIVEKEQKRTSHCNTAETRWVVR